MRTKALTILNPVWALIGLAWIFTSPPAAAFAATAPGDHACRKVTLNGSVSQGQQWSSPFGQGLEIRLVPISPSDRGYSGWDLVVNPTTDHSYPDALLLATPPYGSLSQREIGTTFGLRAQDAIAWNPRRFSFLISPGNLKHARSLFAQIMSAEGSKAAATEPARSPQANPSAANSGPDSLQVAAQSSLLGLLNHPSTLGSGQFSVLDAKLFAGTADPPAFAQQWAAHLSQVPHTMEQAPAQIPGQATGQSGALTAARGELHWIRFSLTLWLPWSWKTASGLHAEATTCAE